MAIFNNKAKNDNKTTAVDMTKGFIPKLLLFFCVPLILGNFFQVLYNTVDTMVVGNFVGKEALAAVGSTGTIVGNGKPNAIIAPTGSFIRKVGFLIGRKRILD